MSGTGIHERLVGAFFPAPATASGETIEAGTSVSRLLREVSLCLAGTLLLALSSKVSVPLLPVPMTLQPLAVLCMGAAYGTRLSVLTVIAYLVCGICGLPVFANTPPFPAGPLYLLGPTGGFLLSYIPAAAIMGVTAEAKLDRKFLTMLPCALIANATILAFGLFWLAFVAHVGTSSHGIGMAEAWSKGVAPFVFGNILKAALAAAILPAGWALVGTRQAP
ncbi:MAG: biotin transporter BioY [Hyphomicrobiales bacterium]|nr:biotin transporter BioY [Hyphomicrobiales bacterium]